MHDELGIALHDLIPSKSPAYKKLGLDKRKVSESQLIALMVQEPRLIRRPLIILNDKPIIGFDRTILTEELRQ